MVIEPQAVIFFLLSCLVPPGVKILFRVALVLLKHTLGSSQQLADSPGLYETLEKLKHIPDSVVQEDFLAAEVRTFKHPQRITYNC